MISIENDANAGRQEFIDLLCRITNSNENSTAAIEATDEQEIIEEGEIIAVDDNDEQLATNGKEIEDGELTESDGSDSDDVEVLNLRLKALRSLSIVKKREKSHQKSKPRRKKTSRPHDDIDLRFGTRNRSSSNYEISSKSYDDRDFPLDKDYREKSVFDTLLSLISPNRRATQNSMITNGALFDNYDVQQMDIVDDGFSLSTPGFAPDPMQIPANHVPFFDPLPPLPPPPPSLFEVIPGQTPFHAIHWPRPNFVPMSHVQSMPVDPWLNPFPTTADVDLRHSTTTFNQAESIVPKKRKTSKKVSKKRREPAQKSTPIVEQPNEQKNQEEIEDESERLLREELLRTLTNKRQMKSVENKPTEPERIVTIVPAVAPEPSANETRYTVDNRYKRVKANVSSSNLVTTSTARVSQPQPIIQTRNKIVRIHESDLEIPQSNQIIITFDETNSEDEDEEIRKNLNSPPAISTAPMDPHALEEFQAIKRLQTLHEAALRRPTVNVEPKKTEVPLPSTDELSAVFEKRRLLLKERSRYSEIQEKMKRKKFENGLIARDIERLQEQINNKKSQFTTNEKLLKYWQKEALAIAQNIKQQEALILESTVFKTPTAPPVKTQSQVDFDYGKIGKVFEENNKKLLLSMLICPWSICCQIASYELWFNAMSKNRSESANQHQNSEILLRTRKFVTDDVEHFWKASLQAYSIDIHQIFCPYELQGSCKAQTCIYQHQHQINQRIEKHFSKTENTDYSQILKTVQMFSSIPSFDVDLNIFEKKIKEKQYQRCRAQLDRYLSIYQEDFRYFRGTAESTIHPILINVSNQLESDDFSLERAVADLVEGLELQRNDAQLWCLYLEFSSWQTSDVEFYHLCLAALKNAQSYDLFWTIFSLCTNHFQDFLSIYFNYLQSDQLDFPNRSYAICELAMFDAYLSQDSDEINRKFQNYISNKYLTSEDRLYLILVDLYTFSFASFPSILYQIIEERRFTHARLSLDAFICPWYAVSNYSHSPDEIDRFFDKSIDSEPISELYWPLYLNKVHYLKASKRNEQCRSYLEFLIERFPQWNQVWIEYLLISNDSTEILTRAKVHTGGHYEYLYALSFKANIETMLKSESIVIETSRERCFYDLCHLLSTKSSSINKRLVEKYHGPLRDLLMFNSILHFHRCDDDVEKEFLDYLSSYESFSRNFVVYSLFSMLEINDVFDRFLSIHSDQDEWIFRPFAYRLLELSIRKDRNASIWIRFDGFVKQFLNNSTNQEIYLTILQRLITSLEEKRKIVRLCRHFENQYPSGHLISRQFRQIVFQSISDQSS